MLCILMILHTITRTHDYLLHNCNRALFISKPYRPPKVCEPYPRKGGSSGPGKYYTTFTLLSNGEASHMGVKLFDIYSYPFTHRWPIVIHDIVHSTGPSKNR